MRMCEKEKVVSTLEAQMPAEELAYWMDFAAKVARKYTGRSDPEYTSIAGRALLRALRTYTPAKKVPFYGWVAFLVRRALAYNLRKAKRARTKTVQEQLFWDRVPDTRDESQTAAWEVLEKLSEFDRAVVRMYFIEGLTVKEIAGRIPGVSAKRLYTYMGKLRARLWALREDLQEAVKV